MTHRTKTLPLQVVDERSVDVDGSEITFDRPSMAVADPPILATQVGENMTVAAPVVVVIPIAMYQ
jgi:hypothetical protein